LKQAIDVFFAVASPMPGVSTWTIGEREDAEGVAPGTILCSALDRLQ